MKIINNARAMIEVRETSIGYINIIDIMNIICVSVCVCVCVFVCVCLLCVFVLCVCVRVRELNKFNARGGNIMRTNIGTGLKCLPKRRQRNRALNHARASTM